MKKKSASHGAIYKNRDQKEGEIIKEKADGKKKKKKIVLK